MVSESIKLKQIAYDLMGEVIHWELCKRLNFEYISKLYMHKLESVQENEMHKILWDFEIQTDHLILARRPNVVMINKKRQLAD